jgi:YesN/AraC family two-component response regulator
LAVLCQEDQRLQFKRQLADSEMSLDVIASALHLPAQYVRNLFRDEFEAILSHLLEA